MRPERDVQAIMDRLSDQIKVNALLLDRDRVLVLIGRYRVAADCCREPDWDAVAAWERFRSEQDRVEGLA